MELREIRGYASSTRRCMLSGGLPGLTLRELLQVCRERIASPRALAFCSGCTSWCCCCLRTSGGSIRTSQTVHLACRLGFVVASSSQCFVFPENYSAMEIWIARSEAHHIFVCQCVDERLIGTMCVDWH